MSLAAYDLEFGTRLVAGADECGRGCLAGPLTAAAVVFNRRVLYELPGELAGLDDSKRLSPTLRAALVGPILRHAERAAIVSVPAWRIDCIGIQAANLQALGRALELASGQLEDEQVTRLSDGYAARTDLSHRGVVRGDQRSLAVAAASVLAKQSRDGLMQRLALQYPVYGFERHAGYPTRAHRQALSDYGPCPQHRRSFRLLPA